MGTCVYKKKFFAHVIYTEQPSPALAPTIRPTHLFDNKIPFHQLAEGNNFELLRNQPVNRFLAVAKDPDPKSAVDTDGFPEVDLIQKCRSG